MTDIVELERRLTAAMDRIARGLDGLGQAPAQPEATAAAPTSDESAALRAALEEERTANAQLQERVRVLHEKQDTSVAVLNGKVEEQRARLRQLDGELQRLKQVNDQLRASNQALREANARATAEPHLINKAMLAELEALRAMRSVERVEAEAILAELKPLVEGAANA